MVVNFRARGISRGTRKLTRTPTLNLKKRIVNLRSPVITSSSFLGLLETYMVVNFRIRGIS
jgi:hypothetical protein